MRQASVGQVVDVESAAIGIVDPHVLFAGQQLDVLGVDEDVLAPGLDLL